ncbi:unnamed protein product, partial [Amoebophrya sp. A120]
RHRHRHSPPFVALEVGPAVFAWALRRHAVLGEGLPEARHCAHYCVGAPAGAGRGLGQSAANFVLARNSIRAHAWRQASTETPGCLSLPPSSKGPKD